MTGRTTASEGGLGDDSEPEALPADCLYRACDRAALAFGSTEELEPLDEPLGQGRALEALELGAGLGRDGYNVFVLGSTGLGKHTVVRRFLQRRASDRPVPSDWCYVNNFKVAHKPQVLELPAGTGERLRQDMARCVEELLVAIPTTFQSDEYRERAQQLAKTYGEREEQAFEALADKARQQGIALLRTPAGYTLAPLRDDKVLGPSEFSQLPEDEKARIEEVIAGLKEELKAILARLPVWQKQGRDEFKKLNRQIIALAVGQLFDELERRYQGFEAVIEYLRSVREDVVDNVDAFRPSDESSVSDNPRRRIDEFPQYAVNVLVDNGEAEGAPVVYEDNPSYSNLLGRIEHTARFGALLTNFTLIKPGALHRANGGYLILDAARVLTQPFAWESLKRALRSRELRVESVERLMSLLSTTSLEPEPIQLDLKVVLFGDRMLYYLLQEHDPEFGLLFKVAADFSEETERSDDNVALFARLIATLQRQDGLRPLDAGAVARVIEHCARRIGDAEKISLHVGSLLDLLRESDYAAGVAACDRIGAEHVEQAVNASIRRSDQVRERVHENILRDIRLVDTGGKKVGQVNGLSVFQLGAHAFGQPSRITATARLGSGGVLDIEREVELGGSLHSKGVLILSAFLGARYARDNPLPMAASLVFEQSYAEIEGDSASVAELCALLSALSGLPVRQSIAVTGSVNQHGQVQAVGGVNAKIEGFFDICNARGLSGEQGVVIPSANVKHLMLRADVVAAARDGRFRVYAASNVDQAIALLTGVEGGDVDEAGEYPPDTVNGRVQRRVRELIALRKLHSDEGKHDDGNEGLG